MIQQRSFKRGNRDRLAEPLAAHVNSCENRLVLRRDAVRKTEIKTAQRRVLFRDPFENNRARRDGFRGNRLFDVGGAANRCE